MTEPISDSDLAQLLVRVAAIVRAPGKPIPMHICRFLIADIPMLVAEVRRSRAEADGLDAAGAAGVEALTQHVTELQQQLATRTAQCERMRMIIEGAEVAT
jgi:hypothetical protein